VLGIDVAAPYLWALRWLLFLGPLAATIFLVHRNRLDRRCLVGGLFAFLYGLAMIFVMHQLAMAIGWWKYGGDVLMFMGLPADIWIGGALLFGSALYFAFPRTAPLLLILPIVVGLHGTIFKSLQPFVQAGEGWFVGVVLVFAIAHVPAIYLARWTAVDEKLALRAALLAIGYGFLAFAVLPSLIMQALGGSWGLEGRPAWLLVLCVPLLALSLLIGLSAVQTFVVHGEGTAVPLDPTKRLVRMDLFAYVTNPMQLSTALTWIFMGIALGNPWVASAALMAWVFVQGMVRWHHRNDLLVRFPDGWPEYRKHVPEWIPRWRPWASEPARLTYDPSVDTQMRLVGWLRRRELAGVDIVATPDASTLGFVEAGETRTFTGLAAFAKALNRINFGFALVGAVLLLMVLPSRCFITQSNLPRRPGSTV
jgi:protein-S-isoprenylcysteine O-methyltransferase Ste14